jgi:hypothetical protein
MELRETSKGMNRLLKQSWSQDTSRHPTPDAEEEED